MAAQITLASTALAKSRAGDFESWLHARVRALHARVRAIIDAASSQTEDAIACCSISHTPALFLCVLQLATLRHLDSATQQVFMHDRLPDESKSTDHVEDVFVTRMGFTKAETVVLMGAHSMGKMEPLNTGYAGKWDRTFAQLDNIYFSQIIDRPWKRFTVDETVEFNGQAPVRLSELPLDLARLSSQALRLALSLIVCLCTRLCAL